MCETRHTATAVTECSHHIGGIISYDSDLAVVKSEALDNIFHNLSENFSCLTFFDWNAGNRNIVLSQ